MVSQTGVTQMMGPQTGQQHSFMSQGGFSSTITQQHYTPSQKTSFQQQQQQQQQPQQHQQQQQPQSQSSIQPTIPPAPPQQQQPPQSQPSQQTFRPAPSGSSSSPLPTKFGGQTIPPGSSFTPQTDQGSMSSFSSTSSVFSGISTKMDGHVPSGQNTPIGQRDELSTAYCSSTSLTNQVSGVGQINRSSSSQSQPFTPTQVSSYGTGSNWPGASQSNENIVAASAGSTGGLSSTGGPMHESTDSFGRKFTSIGSSSAVSPPISSGGSYQAQPQTGGQMVENSSAGGPSRPFVPPRQTSLRSGTGVEDSDDTMKNLRKTFAGIFGDM
ncbi:unnamed protein product [Echinostoma caproni]|uniref:Synapsin_C domain-containing protein n=1 Tax=Echinostoma caproni TaxID=27848 RepID=A0A183A6H1_9TREM|nr:unnamed protein product [Echinostoma caproni]